MNYKLLLLWLLIFADLITLNVLRQFYIETKPGFSYTHTDHDLSGAVFALVIITIMLFVFYYIVYITGLIVNIREMKKQSISSKLTFTFT